MHERVTRMMVEWCEHSSRCYVHITGCGVVLSICRCCCGVGNGGWQLEVSSLTAAARHWPSAAADSVSRLRPPTLAAAGHLTTCTLYSTHALSRSPTSLPTIDRGHGGGLSLWSSSCPPSSKPTTSMGMARGAPRQSHSRGVGRTTPGGRGRLGGQLAGRTTGSSSSIITPSSTAPPTPSAHINMRCV